MTASLHSTHPVFDLLRIYVGLLGPLLPKVRVVDVDVVPVGCHAEASLGK